MLTTPEKFLFFLVALASIYATIKVAERIIRIISGGHGKPCFRIAWKKLVTVLAKTISLQPTFRVRIIPSLFHALIAWGFMIFLVVNIGDLLEAFIPGFSFLGEGTIGNLYRLSADIFSVLALIGMIALLIRRFVFKPSELSVRQDVLLNPKARKGIRRDSAIVGGFILIHISARLLGEIFSIALKGYDLWQPLASSLASRISGISESILNFGEHVAFWLALGTILIFIPYFLYSKHIHLIFAPINYLFKPNRQSIGELSRLDFEDESVEQFGAIYIEDLGWEQLMDAYACIMCYRCQEECPAYNTGKTLSPATLEINKRYLFNHEGANLAKGENSAQTLLEFAIPYEAIWACTSCGACIDICPVNNEPMRDILDIRRGLVLMDNDFPEQLQISFRGMERSMNPWNIPQSERMKWADGLNVPTIEANPEPDLLWWVGCAPATDTHAQKTARAFAEILSAAKVNYAVLGENEQCTGDSARRAGNEFLFNELALSNVDILNEVNPKRIVTTCPHCMHTLKNEYPAFGGDYVVIHHSQLINELVASGNLEIIPDGSQRITYHDPCYLGRQNQIIDEPRQTIELTGADLIEMPRNGRKSFCCGAGGAQMWKEEEHGTERISTNRFQEAQSTDADILVIGCPFCLSMLNDAKNETSSDVQILDIAEIVASKIVTKQT